MAGIYADAPSRRKAYDSDGSVLLYYKWDSGPSQGAGIGPPYWNAGTWGTMLNNEDVTSRITLDYTDVYWFGLVFPEDWEVDGVHVNSYELEYWHDHSDDTTNAIDGTWTTDVISRSDDSVTSSYRTNITSLALTGVRSIRQFVKGSSSSVYMRSWHVYGTISPGETPDRIIFLDTENSDAEFSKVLDYGEVPRGQTQQRTIKIKNNSASYTINTLQLTAEDLFLNAGGFYTFSLDDVSYQATLNTIGNLGPGATKLIYVKQSVPDAETLGVQAGRFKIVHASLT